MDLGQLPLDGNLTRKGGRWNLHWNERLNEPEQAAQLSAKKTPLLSPKIGPAIGPATHSQVTIANFVEDKFLPEHVSLKRFSGRAHYRAILKHVLKPERLDRLFNVHPGKSKGKLKSCSDWPYLDDMLLDEVRPEHVQGLISAALERGYSTQTAKHIRNVVSAIFSHAIEEQCFEGENPARHVTLPKMIRKQAHVLTAPQTKEVLSSMRYPEREMTLLAVLTGMDVAEICGLQWKCVNLTGTARNAQVGPVSPATIAIRKHLYRGDLAAVAKNRERIVRISKPLVSVLRRLSQRAKFVAPDDFVFISRNGSPINQTNILARRLRPIGENLQIPWLNWQVFRRAHARLASESGRQFQEFVAEMADADSLRDSGRRQKWPGPGREASLPFEQGVVGRVCPPTRQPGQPASIQRL